MPTTAPHVLVVTADPQDPADEDLYDYTIECPGVTDHCREYEECLADEAEEEALERAVGNEQPAVAHGKRHLKINSAWMAETDRCHVQCHDGMPDAAAGRFKPGRHPIDFDFNSPDDGDIQIIAINAPAATR